MKASKAIQKPSQTENRRVTQINMLKPQSNPVDNSDSGYDCLVVGSGHAGSCAALAAIDAGCKKGECHFHLCTSADFSDDLMTSARISVDASDENV